MQNGITDHQAIIGQLRGKGMKWREISALPEYDGIPPGSLCAFYKGKWIPKDNKVRRQLGLTEIITVESKRNHLGRFTEIDHE